MAGSTILRDMGAGWLECQDAQGIFYHNQMTQQSSDSIPPELMAAAAPAQGQPDVLRQLAANWLECQDAQGIFYFNQLTKQSSDTLPAELMVADAGPVAMAAPMAAPMMMMAAQPVAAAGGAQTLRELPNNWLECKDEQGIFYFNQATQQSSDTLPAELAGFDAVQAPMTIQAAPASYTPVQIAPQPYVQQVSAAAPSYTPVQQFPQQQYVQPTSYLPAPVTQPQYMQTQVAAAPASYLPPQQQFVQQVQAAPASYLPPQVAAAPASYLPAPMTQQQYMQQMGQPQVVYQQAQQAQPQVVQAQPPQQPQVVQAQPQMLYQQQAQQQAYGSVQVMQAQPPTQAQAPVQMQASAQAGARKKSAFGDWVVYEDAQGEFFMQASTGQQFTTPPPAMVQSYQAHKAAGLVVP